jgi:hypothetical protein
VEYEAMRVAYCEKGRSRHSKIESFSSGQLQTSFLEYQEEAALFIFRMKSLKQGQFLSILIQAARHHAAQVTCLDRTTAKNNSYTVVNSTTIFSLFGLWTFS